MIEGFMRKDPTNSTRLHAHPQVVDIFTRANWMNFFEKFQGFNEEIAQEFSLSMVPYTRTHANVTTRGFSMEITLEFISRFTTLPLGLSLSKDEKPIGQDAKKKFFQNNETPVEDKNGIRRASIPYPWDEVSYQIILYRRSFLLYLKTILTYMDSLINNIKSYHGRDMMDNTLEFEKLRLSRAKLSSNINFLNNLI